MEPFYRENKAFLVSLCQTLICNKLMTKRRERFKSAKYMILCILLLDFVLYVLRMGFFNHKILSGLHKAPLPPPYFSHHKFSFRLSLSGALASKRHMDGWKHYVNCSHTQIYCGQKCTG